MGLLCKWPGAAQIEIWYGRIFVNLVNGLKPCCYITLLRTPHHWFHGYHLSLLSMRYRCRISFPHMRRNVKHEILPRRLVCLLSLCSSCRQEVDSHSGQWHRAARVSRVKKALTDEGLNVFGHPHTLRLHWAFLMLLWDTQERIKHFLLISQTFRFGSLMLKGPFHSYVLCFQNGVFICGKSPENCKACTHQKMVNDASSLSQLVFTFVVRLRKVIITAAKERGRRRCISKEAV